MYLGVIGAIIILPVCIMGIIAVNQKMKRSKDTAMYEEDFVVEFPDSIVSIGIIISLFSAGIMLGITMFTKKIPHISFYIVFGVFFWLGCCLIFRALTYKIIVKDKSIAVYSSFGRTCYFTFSDINSAIRKCKTGKTRREEIIIKTDSGKQFKVKSGEICYKYFKERIKSQIPKEKLFGFGMDNNKN